MNRKIKVFIVISVLLNVLLLGIVLGHVMHRMDRPHGWRFHVPPEISELSPEKQKLFREAMERVREEGKARRQEIRKVREEAIGILTAEPFDEAAYQEKVTALHQLKGQHMQRLADAVKELAKHFTPEERAILAKSLRRPPPHFANGRGPGEAPEAPPHGDTPPE